MISFILSLLHDNNGKFNLLGISVRNTCHLRVSVHDEASGSMLDYFNLMFIYMSVWAPDCTGIFQDRPYHG